MAVALETVVKQLKDSGIISPGKLENFIPPQGHPKDAAELARELVKSGNLTPFQGHQVLNGKVKALFLGNYTILDKLGAGGMGQVFKAQHRRMDRLVALKMLPAKTMKDAATVARFEREVRAAAKLRHPNIVAADDADEANGNHFLVMEYIEGRDLSALVKKDGPFSVAKAVNCILQAARGLEFAHKKGVVHRDIKPANLLLDSEGTVKILDMGLARIDANVGDATQAELTGTGAIMGTVDYMAPEQGVSTKDADARADVYSLGCTLHFLLIGKPVYDGDSVAAKLLAHHHQPIPSLHKLRAEVPEQLDAVFQKMVAKKIEDRYQSMTEVIAALQASGMGHDQSFTMQTFGTTGENNAFTFLREAPVVATKQKPQPTKKTAGLANKGGFKNKKPLLIGAGAAGFLVVLLGVIFIVKDKSGKEVGRIEVPEGGSVEVQTTATKPTIVPKVTRKNDSNRPWNTPSFQAWIKDVAALPAEKQVEAVKAKLMELNPGFDGKVTDLRENGTPKIEKGVVTELAFVSNNVADISPVRALAGLKALRSINTTYNNKLSDLSPLQGMRLTILSFPYTQVSDLTPLQGMPLTELDCGGTIVSNFSPLQGMPLTILRCGKTRVSELSFLRGMRLTVLRCSNTTVSDLSFLQGMPLTDLECAHTKVSDLSPLKGMRLTSLNCGATEVSDLSPLEGMDLTEVYFTPEKITKGLDVVRRMKNVNAIGINSDGRNKYSPDKFWMKYDAGEFGKSITNINDPVFQQWVKDAQAMPAEKQVEAVAKKLVELNPGFDGKVTADGKGTPKIENGVVTQVWLFTEHVRDIAPLRALAGLKSLYCFPGGNASSPLSDLSPLHGMGLTALYLSGTRVSDLSHLRGLPLTTLQCNATPVFDLSPLEGLPLTSLNCGSSKVTDLSCLKGMHLKSLDCYNTQVSNLSPLRGMHLTQLNCGNTKISDLTPLQGMPLSTLIIDRTSVSDASPLQGMNLTTIALTPENITKGMEIIRQMKSLKTLGLHGDKDTFSPPEFWKKYDAGEFGKPVATTRTWESPAFQQWMRIVAALPAEKQIEAVSKKLMELNPGFDGKVTPHIREGAVRGLVFASDAVTDITPVRAINELEVLNIPASDQGSEFSDLAQIARMRLRRLDIARTNVQDLAPLVGMPLTELYCFRTGISTLTPLKGMALTRLHCEATNITDLSPIKGMPLVSLFCHNSKVSDLSPLLDCKDLKELNITITKVTPAAVAALQKALPNCKIEWDDPKRIAKPWESPAFQQWIKGVQALPAEEQVEAVSKKLMELNPGFDGKVTDYAGKGMPRIINGVVKEFSFSTANVADISPVRALIGLTSLTCGSIKGLFSDLSQLRGMSLSILGCSNTQVCDLSPLRGMPLSNVYCSNTPVADLSPLAECKNLGLLIVTKTKVTPATVAALQKALPNCKIEWDDPAKPKTPAPAPAGKK